MADACYRPIMASGTRQAVAAGYRRGGVMLRHECSDLIKTVRPQFLAAGYDLRVDEQRGDAVHVFITELASGSEDPKPVHIGAELIRRRDTGGIVELLGARCPFVNLLHASVQTGHSAASQAVREVESGA